jgi:Zn-dependent protease
MGIDWAKALVWIVPLVIAITFHEVAHGYVARLFGDQTANNLGRISLNPIRHIDPFGTVIMPLVLALTGAPIFGYAKAVPVDMRNFKHPRRDMMWVSAAGPGMNLVLAIVGMAAFRIFNGAESDVGKFIETNFLNFVLINVSLAVFNMIPLPPLDGGKVMAGLLPENLGRAYYGLERYGMILLLGLLVVVPMIGNLTGRHFDILGNIIGPPIQWIVQHLAGLFGLQVN